jgi:hypothetical protein
MNGVVCFRVFCDIPYTKYDSSALSCVMRIAQYDIRYTQYEIVLRHILRSSSEKTSKCNCWQSIISFMLA